MEYVSGRIIVPSPLGGVWVRASGLYADLFITALYSLFLRPLYFTHNSQPSNEVSPNWLISFIHHLPAPSPISLAKKAAFFPNEGEVMGDGKVHKVDAHEPTFTDRAFSGRFVQKKTHPYLLREAAIWRACRQFQCAAKSR